MRCQTGEALKQTKTAMRSPLGSLREDEGEESSNSSGSSSDEDPHERSKGGRIPSTNSNDFRFEIPKFEGKLDPDKFVEWLNTI